MTLSEKPAATFPDHALMNFPNGTYFNYSLDRSTTWAFHICGSLTTMTSETRWMRTMTAIRLIRDAFDMWRASRRLLGADDAMLADIGVSRGNIDWLVHHGRQR
jgi:hypothetical protein